VATSYWDNLVQEVALALARWSAEAASQAVLTLLASFGSATEPNLGALAPTYDRMLGVSLLLAGAFISLALIEQNLGGPKGAGGSVVIRTLCCVLLAFCGLSLVQYGADKASLLAGTWSIDFLGQNRQLAAKVTQLYSMDALSGPALGSIAGLIATALLTVLLALFVYVELILRAALLLVTTAFIPFVCVMAIWPRLAGAAIHLAEFLAALLLSKFVIATSVYIGYSTVVGGLLAPANGSSANGMAVGLTALTIAAFAPVVLLQGISFGQVAAAPMVRGWATTSSKWASALWTSASKAAGPTLSRITRPKTSAAAASNRSRANSRTHSARQG
jgi:hypothetical protein